MTGPLGRRAVLSGFAAAALCGAAAGGARPAAARPLDEVMARGRLRVAVYRDFPPFSARVGGTLAGIDVDLARAIAGRLGVSAELVEHIPGETVSDDLRTAVWKGYVVGGEPADVMMHIPFNKQFQMMNLEAVLFGPYHRETFAMARNPERMPEAALEAMPDGDPIGVEIDSIPDFFAMGYQGGHYAAQVEHFPTVEAAVAALLAGRVALALGPTSQIEAALGARREDFPMTQVAFPGMPTRFWDVGMAVKENSRDLAYAVTDAVNAMLDDGTMAAIFKAHGVTHAPIPVE